MIVLFFYWRDVYGRALRYPSDAAQAAAFTRLTGRATLNDGDVAALGALGFDVRADPTADPRYSVEDPLADGPQ